MRPPRLYAAALLALGVALAGCSPGEEDGPAATTTAPDPAPAAGGDVTCEDPPPVRTDGPTFTDQRPPETPSAEVVTATLATNCGDIVLELDGERAPVTVASFEFLAGNGYWQDSPCHRLTTSGIFVLQCGDPTGTGRGAPGYTFGIENAPADGSYPRGSVAMARAADPDSNGGQFFVVYDDTRLPVEGGGYSIFGRVTSGMEIVDLVAAQGVDGGGADGQPAQPISILSVEVTGEEATES